MKIGFTLEEKTDPETLEEKEAELKSGFSDSFERLGRSLEEARSKF